MNITSSIYVYLIYKKKNSRGRKLSKMLVHPQTSWGGLLYPQRSYATRTRISWTLSHISIYSSVLYLPSLRADLSLIRNKHIYLCSIGVHLFIHSLSHLASEGLTWRSLRPSKEKVKEPTSLAKLPRTLPKAHNSKNPKFSAQGVS